MSKLEFMPGQDTPPEFVIPPNSIIGKAQMKFTTEDHFFLSWVYQRMILVHQENQDTDYMIKFKAILEMTDPNTNQVNKKPPVVCSTCDKVLPDSLVLQAQHYKDHITEFWGKINHILDEGSRADRAMKIETTDVDK